MKKLIWRAILLLSVTKVYAMDVLFFDNGTRQVMAVDMTSGKLHQMANMLAAYRTLGAGVTPYNMVATVDGDIIFGGMLNNEKVIAISAFSSGETVVIGRGFYPSYLSASNAIVYFEADDSYKDFTLNYFSLTDMKLVWRSAADKPADSAWAIALDLNEHQFIVEGKDCLLIFNKEDGKKTCINADFTRTRRALVSEAGEGSFLYASKRDRIERFDVKDMSSTPFTLMDREGPPRILKYLPKERLFLYTKPEFSLIRGEYHSLWVMDAHGTTNRKLTDSVPGEFIGVKR